MKNLIGLLSGLVFGFGLAASGLTNPQKVLGFLDIFGMWQADLMFVMASALVITLSAFRFVLRRHQPILDNQFHLPTGTHLDKRLTVGSAIFGVGWGVYGYCPGPALSALAYGHYSSVVFVVAMTVGMAAVHWIQKKWVR